MATRNPRATVHEVPLESVVLYQNNPRTFSETQIEQMARLIEAHGFRIPVLATKDGKRWALVDGHLRMAAAAHIGMQHVPLMDVSDMSPEQVRAFRLSVNRAAEISSWDYTKLAQEFDVLSALPEDAALTALTGFNEDETTKILRKLAQESPASLPGKDVSGQQVSQSADRRRVQSENDTVELVLAMTVAQRTRALDALDRKKQADDLPTRAAAFLSLLGLSESPDETPAPRARTRPRT